MVEGLRKYKIGDRRERRQVLLSKNNEVENFIVELKNHIALDNIKSIRNILQEMFAEEIDPSNIYTWLDRLKQRKTSLEELKYDRLNFPEFGFNEFS